MNPNDLDRIRFVTRNFERLQGPRWVLLGLLMLELAIISAIFHRTPGPGSKAWLYGYLASCAGFLLLGFLAKLYYAKRFGEVERQTEYGAARRWQPVRAHDQLTVFSPAGFVPRIPSPPFWSGIPGRQWLKIALGLAAYALVSVLYMKVVMEGSPAALARMEYLIMGSGYAAYWIWHGSRSYQAHYLVIGGLLAVLAAPGSYSGLLLPNLAGPGIERGLFGVSLIVAGLLDHRLLARTLKRPAVEPLAAAALQEARVRHNP